MALKLHKCGKRVKIKSRKLLEGHSNVCKSYMENLVGGAGWGGGGEGAFWSQNPE